MKIIEHGIAIDGENPIIRCEYCGCVFTIDSREDLSGKYLIDVSSDKRVFSYSCRCPDCKNEIIIGPDPRDLKGYYSMKYSYIFSRPDWVEKFGGKPVLEYEFESALDLRG